MMINSRCKGLLEVTDPRPGHQLSPISTEIQVDLAACAQHNWDATVTTKTGPHIVSGNQQDLDKEWDMTAEALPASLPPINSI